MTTIDLVLSILAVPVSVANAYLLSLTLLSWQKRALPYGAPDMRFAVVVPAHDEEAGIGDTVKNLLSLDYPKDRFSVTVVAEAITLAPVAFTRWNSAGSGRPKWKLTIGGRSSSTSAQKSASNGVRPPPANGISGSRPYSR